MYNHKQWSRFAKDSVGKKPPMLSLSSTTEKNHSLVEKKKDDEGWGLGTFLMQHSLLFTALCNAVWFAVVYVKNAFAGCPCDADGNTIRREPDSASLFESNNQTLPTLQQAEQQRIMQNTGELTMTKAPVRLRNLHLDHSAISPWCCCRRFFMATVTNSVSLPAAKTGTLCTRVQHSSWCTSYWAPH